MPRRAFTVQEANALIPALEAALQRVEQRRTEMRRLYEKLQVLEVLWEDRLLDPANPDHTEATIYRRAVEAGARDIDALVRREITGRGLRFPAGGLANGLVDFATTWDNRWVYLCWHRGEPAIQAWHEVDEGFAGRQPITPEQEQRMGREWDPASLDDSMLDF